MRLVVLFDVLGREPQDVDFQVSFYLVYLEDTSGNQGYQAMGVNLDFVQVECSFYRSFQTKYDYFTFQSDGKVGIQAQ